jgi:hypothetical protein
LAPQPLRLLIPPPPPPQNPSSARSPCSAVPSRCAAAVPPHHRAPVTASCRESFARVQDHPRGQPVSIPAPLAPESTRSRAAGKRPPFRFSRRHWCSGRPEPRYPFAAPARTFSTLLQTRRRPAAVHPRVPPHRRRTTTPASALHSNSGHHEPLVSFSTFSRTFALGLVCRSPWKNRDGLLRRDLAAPSHLHRRAPRSSHPCAQILPPLAYPCHVGASRPKSGSNPPLERRIRLLRRPLRRGSPVAGESAAARAPKFPWPPDLKQAALIRSPLV